MKKLYLSKDKKLAGVCGGVAEYYDTDPTLIRLAWIVITIVTGVVPGLIAYIVAAIVMPQQPEVDVSKDTHGHEQEVGSTGAGGAKGAT